MTDTRLRTAAAGLVLAAGLLVSGCGLIPSPAPSTSAAEPSGSATGEPGTQAEQCAQVLAQVQSIGDDIGRLGEMVANDPFGALGLLTSISERVGSLQAQVTDPELLERIGEIQAGWDALVADAQESLGAGDASGLQRAADQVAQLGQQVTELQQFCTGA